MSHRCRTCNGLIGPEDAVGGVTQPALCATCRGRAEKRAAEDAAKNHPAAIKGRRLKALAMVEVIDANFVEQFPHLDPYDQSGRIRLASLTWTDEKWADIGESALKPDGTNYERKDISRETRDLIREIYQGRATAPLASRRAS